MNKQPDIEQLVCALMFLLNRQAHSPESSLARHICEHLSWLLEHPDTRRLPVLQKTCKRLLLHWQAIGSVAQNGDEVHSGAPKRILH